MKNWLKTLAKVAPTIASAIGGPMAAVAVNVATKALGLNVNDENALAEAVASGDPNVLLKLKEAENNFKLELKRLEIKEEELFVEDRDSARKREIATKDKAPAILAATIVLGFFGVFYFVFTTPINENSSQAVYILVGALTAGLTQVLNYYFGSSKGSADKTQELAKLAIKK